MCKTINSITNSRVHKNSRMDTNINGAKIVGKELVDKTNEYFVRFGASPHDNLYISMLRSLFSNIFQSQCSGSRQHFRR